MSLAATDLRELLTISIKTRHDSFTDQYNRVFMTKMLMVVTILTGISWYSDDMNCFVPGDHGAHFAGQACWIRGVYIYRDMANRLDESGFYGMPRKIEKDGYLRNTETKTLCSLHPPATLGKVDKFGRPIYPDPDENCVPFQKSFFLQYQYFPFITAALSLLFFLPYLMFKKVNADLIQLKDDVEADEPDIAGMAKKYFKFRKRQSNLRIILNIIIKILYIIANVAVLLAINDIFLGEYISYGSRWIKWAQLPNHLANDYMGSRAHPKPGNELVPPFGYCEVASGAKDIQNSYYNSHKVVCEMSQNVLYQYVLAVLWFTLILGIVISIIGLLQMIFHYLVGIFGFKTYGPTGKRIFKKLSFRELEYLEYMRSKNIEVYGEMLDKLREVLLNEMNPPRNDDYKPRENAPIFDEKKSDY